MSLLAIASCTDDYPGVNSHPYQPGDLSPDDYALGAAMNNLAGCVVSPDVNTAQFTDCLLGGPMGGYFADSNAGWANTISNYNPKDDWTNVFLRSDRIIPVLYTNLKAVETVSVQTNNPVPLAIAHIIKVAAMHRVTDAYGPIPYSQIGEEGSTASPYDDQKKVYEKFFEELNAAIETLTQHSYAALVPSADYIYGGDVKKWIRFANSLKLRLAIRIAYADATLARSMAESAVRQEFGVITSNADNARWNYFTTTQNPLFVATRYNSGDYLTGGDTHAAADIVCYMNGYNDPRREKYFIKSVWPGIDYVGLRRGIVIPALSTSGHKYSGVNLSPSSPLYWMNAAEVAFLRAEGKAVFGFDMGGEAETFYTQGVKLSFEQWEVGGADAYLLDANRTPETYKDPANVDDYLNLLSSVTVRWNEAASPEEKQERIIVQKWIANWQIGNEAWADYRRTGYPHLIPASANGNKSNGMVDSSLGARRVPYPQDEYVSNKENISKAVAEYLKGPDNMATRIWWDCKNK